MKTGKNSVVIGSVPAGSSIGEGSVVIGATDSNGNTILNTPMAVGYGSKAGPGSIAIGAFAGAGVPDLSFPPALRSEMQELVQLAVNEGNEKLIAALEKLAGELRQSQPTRSAVLTAWEGVKSLATMDGAYNVLTRTSAVLLAFLGQGGV